MFRLNFSFILLALSVGLMLIISVNCKVEEGDNPVIDSISPGSKISYLPSFTLTFEGSGFIEDSAIIFNGLEKTTDFISSEKLTCEIDTIDFSPNTSSQESTHEAANSENTTVSVLVHNPIEDPEGGVDSNALDFTVYSNHSFSTPVSIDDRNGEFQDPALVADDSGNISMVYKFIDNSSGVEAIDFIRSTDYGDTWDTPVRLVETTFGCDNPCIARDSEGNLNVALFGFAVVYSMRSADGGTSWTQPSQRSSQSAEPLEPAIAVNADNAIFIAWGQEDFNSDYPLYFVHSADYGSSWSSTLNIFNGWENAVDVYKPAIATDDENGIYVTWTALTTGGENYSYFNYSHDSGASWNPSDTNFGESSCSGIAAAPNGDIYVILASTQAVDIQDVLFRKSTDKGSNWSDALEIASDLSNPVPQMAVDRAGNINVAYYDEGDERLLFRRSTDEGAAWSPVIEAVADNAADMAVTVDWWGNIYFVYVDENSGEIRFVRSN